MSRTIERTRMQPLRFVVVGGVVTVLEYTLFAGLIMAGLNHNLALVADYSICLMLGFVLQRNWTFKSQTGPSASARYLTTYAGLFAANLILLNLFLLTHVSVLVAQLVALVLVSALSYTIQRTWVFGPAGCNARR